MPTIFVDNSLNFIGNTPYAVINNGKGKIISKLEKYNSFGSIKDRTALEMVKEAEKKGNLKKGDTLIEVSSGNTGISLAAISSIKGYNMKVIISENASKERLKLLKLFGAEIIFVKPEDWRSNAVKFGKKLARKNNWKMLNQYENESNVKAHYKTGREILRHLEIENINPDILIIGVGTGGTITGVSKVLKKKFPNMKVIGILPKDKIEGLRDFSEFKPKILDLKVVDKLVKSEEEMALKEVKNLAKKHGLLVGVSSGAAFHLAKKFQNKNVVTIFPDGIEKYMDYI